MGSINMDQTTTQVFTPTTPRICVVCQKSRKGHVEQFIHKFINGLTLAPGKKNYFEKGFLRKYVVRDVVTDFFLSRWEQR